MTYTCTSKQRASSHIMRYFTVLFLTLIVASLNCRSQANIEHLLLRYQAFYSNRQYDSACLVAKAISEAIPIQSRDTSLDYAVSLSRLADCYHELHNTDSAIIIYKQTLLLLRAQYRDSSSVFINSLTNFGIVYRDLGQFHEADSLLTEATYLARQHLGVEHHAYMSTAFNHALIKFNLSDFSSARDILNELLPLQRRLKGEQSKEYERSLSTMGVLYVYSGQLDSALTCANESVRIAKAVYSDTSLRYAGALDNLAFVHASRGETLLSAKVYELCLKIRERHLQETSVEYINNLYNVAVNYYSSGNYEETITQIQHVLNLADSVLGESHPYYAVYSHLLGLTFFELGKYQNAESTFKRSQDVLARTVGKDHNYYCDVQYYLAHNFITQQILDSAETYARACLKCREVSTGSQSPLYGNILTMFGGIHLLRNQPDSAKLFFRRAAEITANSSGTNTSDYAAILNSLGNAYTELNQADSAIWMFNRVLSILTELKVDSYLNFVYEAAMCNLGEQFLLMNKHDSAIKYYSKYFDGVVKRIQDGFAWLNLNERAMLWQKFHDPFGALLSAPTRTGKHATEYATLAYDCALLSKALLLETNREIEAAVAASNDQRLKQSFVELKETRRAYTKVISEGGSVTNSIRQLVNTADSLESILVKEIAGYVDYRRVLSTNWLSIRDKLGEHQAAIEYVRYYDKLDSAYRYYAFITRPQTDAPILVHVAAESDINASVKLKDFQGLYDLVWRPIDTLLNGVDTVFYSPVGVLNNVSFAGLIDTSDDTINTRSRHEYTYLLDRYTLHRLTTSRSIIANVQHRVLPLKPKIALIGAVDYDGIPNLTFKSASTSDTMFYATMRSIIRNKPMAPLPATLTEVETIQEVLSNAGWQTHVFTGLQADERSIKDLANLEKTDILHVATHGFAFPDVKRKDQKPVAKGTESQYQFSDDPMVRSGLLLSGSNSSWTGDPQKLVSTSGEDGILTASEVANLNLTNTKLVVLSACKTGLGKIDGDEGILGLQRGFKLAGVDQLVVSLWSVPDHETMELMTSFYTQLASTHNAESAFEHAQKSMRMKYPSDPEKWAGFVFIR